MFLDNSISDYEKRLEQVERVLSYNNGEIIEYCSSNSTIKSKSQKVSYYAAEQLLDKLATYLLRGQYKKNGIMTIFDIRNAKIKELPLSSTIGNANNLVYSESIDNDGKNNSINAKPDLVAYGKSKKKSKTKKINNIYSTKEVDTYVEKVLKDKYGNKYTDIVPLKIGGHKGIVGLNEPYVAEWSYVNTDNEFSFNGNTYSISEELKQYSISSILETTMEKILCYYIPSKQQYYFFDENIEEINKKYINKI